MANGKRRSRVFAGVLALILLAALLPAAAAAESFFPKVTRNAGVAMPSFGEALDRYPDSEADTDSGLAETWNHVTDEEFDAFGSYLSGAGAALGEYRYDADTAVMEASIGYRDRVFYLAYDQSAQTLTLTYPEGVCDGHLQQAKEAYRQGLDLREAGDWDGAAAAFAEAGSYRDAAAQITETRYLQAQALLRDGKSGEARAVFMRITGYKDVDRLLESDPHLVAARFSPGCYVTFGRCPQSETGSDRTPIEWLVLDVQGDKALLISRYGLDAQPYNTRFGDATWRECSLRTWLNGEFLNSAFTSEERLAILRTNVDNGRSQGYSAWNTNGGGNTSDRIFLLSFAEANKYLGVMYVKEPGATDNTGSRAAPTAYAVSRGVLAYDRSRTADGLAAGQFWWLRSPGQTQNRAAYVDFSGGMGSIVVNTRSCMVRPVLWVNLNADIF